MYYITLHYIMKIGIITQARSNNKRLHRKVLLEVGNKTLLQYHLERLLVLDIPCIVATTIKKEDDKIVEIANSNGWGVFRGDELNVLSRFYKCALQNKFDFIIRVTSDCPLIDIDSIRNGIEVLKTNMDKKTLISNTFPIRTFPKGMDFEIFSFELLEESFKNANQNEHKEHVTPYIYNDLNKKVNFVTIQNSCDTSNIRITLDFYDDYIFIKKLIEDYKANDLSLFEIEKLIQENVELNLMNEKCKRTASQKLS